MSRRSPMARRWDERARADAFHYIESARWDGDVEAFFRAGEERLTVLLDPWLPDRRVLAVEIGCGLGRIARALAGRFERMIGVDVSGEMVERARELHSGLRQIDFRVGDGASIPVETASADLVFSYEVFQHMPGKDVILANLRDAARVLRSDGRAVIHLPYGRRSLRRRLVPERLRSPLRAVLRRGDPLMNDATWGGAGALSDREIATLFEAAGLRVEGVHPDPTHEPGTRVLVVASVPGRAGPT